MSDVGSNRFPDHPGGPFAGPVDGGDGGDDHAVDAALASLAAVGRREQRDLGADTITAIAQAAAAERVGAPATDQDGGRPAPVIEVTPLTPADPSGLRPRPARTRSVLALAAALLVAAGLGAAMLTAGPQQVETQDSAAAGSSERGSDDQEAAEGERPVLDLADSIPTTVVTTPIAAGQPETTAPDAETSAEPVPSTTTPPSSTTSTETPPSTAPPASPSTSAPPTTAGPTVDGRALALQLGVAGTVELHLDDNRPTLGSVSAAQGWSGATTTPRPGAFGYQFDDGYDVASLEVWSEPGWFHLNVDHGNRWPSSTEWTRTVTIERSGTVEVRHGTHGLSGLEILVGPGWEHRVDSVGPDHVLVVITSPYPTREHELRVDAGPATVDIRITGS